MPQPPEPQRALTARDVAPALLVMVCVAALNVPLLRSGRQISRNDDWLKHWTLHANARRCVLEWGQIPLWTPYLGGGFPVIGDPEEPCLSPTFWGTLIAGEVLGVKLDAAAFYALAALGTYCFARWAMAAGPWTAALAGLLFTCCGWIPARLLGGNFNELWFCAFPLLAALLLCRRGVWSFVASTLLLAAMTGDGKIVWPIVLLALGVVGVCWQRGRGLARLAAAVLLAIALAAAKLAPVADLLQTTGGVLSPTIRTHLTADGAIRPVVAYKLGQFVRLLVAGGHDPDRWLASATYVGWLALVMAGAALILEWKRTWRAAAVFALFTWLCFGWRATPDLFALLRRVPPFNTLIHPIKYFNFFVAWSLCLVAAQAAGLFAGTRRVRLRAVVLCVVAAAAIAPLFKSSWGINSNVFRAPAISPERVEPFHQVKGRTLERAGGRPDAAESYRNMLAGIGTIDWHSALQLPEHATPKWLIYRGTLQLEVKDYRGEAYLEPPAGPQDHIEIAAWSPCCVRLRVKARRAAHVVLNQNWSPGWRCNGALAEPHGGLCSFPLPAGFHGAATFAFEPRWFKAGAAVSLAAAGLLVAALVALAGWKARPTFPGRGAPRSAAPSGGGTPGRA